MKDSPQYETRMVVILGLAIGLMSFDQGSLGYLMPFIGPDLALENTQIGELAASYWAFFAISSYATGYFSDSHGHRKFSLVIYMILFSIFSIISGISQNFVTLFCARAAMGLFAGALLALAQSILALDSSPSRRGTNMGIVTSLAGNMFGMFLAPLLLVQIALQLSWRIGFFAVTLPGLVCGLLVYRFIREPNLGLGEAAGRPAQSFTQRLAKILKFRNIWLCAALCCMYVAYVSVGFTFLPLFFTRYRDFSSLQMSFFMGSLGLSAMFYSVLLPWISDRVGRKPVLTVSSLIGLACPLGALYLDTPVALVMALFLGWALAATSSFCVGTIPSETVPQQLVSTSLGLIIAPGVLVGGLAGPALAGWCADRWGLNAPLFFQAGCAAISAIFSGILIETAPSWRKASAAKNEAT